MGHEILSTGSKTSFSVRW